MGIKVTNHLQAFVGCMLSEMAASGHAISEWHLKDEKWASEHRGQVPRMFTTKMSRGIG